MISAHARCQFMCRAANRAKLKHVPEYALPQPLSSSQIPRTSKFHKNCFYSSISMSNFQNGAGLCPNVHRLQPLYGNTVRSTIIKCTWYVISARYIDKLVNKHSDAPLPRSVAILASCRPFGVVGAVCATSANRPGVLTSIA